MSSGVKKLISIVTPCYNEEENIELQFAAVKRELAPFADRYQFEFIFTDNCSKDRTFAKLVELAKADARVRVLRFSRNIGAMRAVFQGLIHARGDAAILIQADLQDPPELIPEFIRGWEAGHDVVYGQIIDRDETFLLRSFRRLYYKIISGLAEVRPPQNAGEFRLTSRRVLDAIALYDEDDIYLRGIVAQIGFAQKAIPYRRSPRVRGQSSHNLFFLLGYAINGLTATTLVPIRLVTILGIFSTLAGVLFGTYLLVVKILNPAAVPTGVTTLASLITFFAGAQLLSLGIIGEYIRKIYVQTLRRPKALIQDKINFGN